MRRYKYLAKPGEKHAAEPLDERESYIVRMRTTAEHPMTLRELAEHFGVTRPRIGQLEARAQRKLGMPPREKKPTRTQIWLAMRAKKAADRKPE